MAVRIVEWQLPYTWGTGIGIDANKVISVLLRDENNLIKVTDENELYTDLQLADGILPTDEFPVGVTVGRVLSADWWYQSGTMLNFKTTSWDYGRWIYGTDNHIYYDAGTGVWQQIYTWPEVDTLFQQLRDSLSNVAFTWDYNDLVNRPVVPVVNDPAITINQNGVQAWQFTLNQSSADTINLTDTTYPAMTAWELGTGTDTTNRVVSAKVIADYVEWKIDTLLALGKFLSLWDASTGQPISFPLATPYTYTTWDYFLVETVGANNKRPSGTSYTGTASTTAETEELEVGDIYIYDWQVWLLQINHWKTVSFANLAGSPSDNTNLATALNAKANDNAVVKLTGTQTIAGTKTFSTSPVVPSKTTSATNSGTKIATEAQVYAVAQNIPTKTSELTNDSGFITSSAVPTKTSQLTNDSGFVTNQVSDTAYGSSWNWVTATAPSKNAVYDKIESLAGTIPTVNNATLTISQWGTSKWTFTANASSNASVDLNTSFLKTQTEYNNLPASKTSDWNFYFIYSS